LGVKAGGEEEKARKHEGGESHGVSPKEVISGQ